VLLKTPVASKGPRITDRTIEPCAHVGVRILIFFYEECLVGISSTHKGHLSKMTSSLGILLWSNEQGEVPRDCIP
jgi:hypothetical protein